MSFNFGSQNTQKPTLGVQPLSFGAGTQVAAVAPQSAPAFGSTAAPAPTFGFGTTAPTASVAPLSFGTPAAPAAASAGLSFGQPQAATSAPGLTLGQPQASSGTLVLSTMYMQYGLVRTTVKISPCSTDYCLLISKHFYLWHKK